MLYPAVRNQAIAQNRKRRRFLPLETEQEIPSSRSSGDLEELASVLSGLPEGQREAVILKYVDDWTFREIAEALEIPEGTVKSRIHNALKTLREDPRTRRYFGLG